MRIRLSNLQRKHAIPRRRAAAIAARILRRFHVRRGELSVVFVGAARMRRINRQYHRRDRVTDVLAFDLRLSAQCRRDTLIGDVIIAPAVAARTARRYGHTYTEELLTYVAHGVLHLLGYRDGTVKERHRMERLQKVLVQ